MIRGAGAVLIASPLAGCYHEDDGGDGGGGDYSIDNPAASKG